MALYIPDCRLGLSRTGCQTGLLLPCGFPCAKYAQWKKHGSFQFPARSCLERANGLEKEEAFGAEAVRSLSSQAWWLPQGASPLWDWMHLLPPRPKP